jgi:tRNA uridine 5-carbamoylmethylation protein Kti12
LELIILIGLPGAGKTTFYRRYFAATHTHISKDLWPHASGREARQRRLIDEALAAGQPVAVDNTNPTIADRAALIAAAHARGARAVGYFIDVSPRVAIARNEERSGRAKIPKVAIFTVAKRLERPTIAEGFDQLFFVQIAGDRSFHVIDASAGQPGAAR